VINLKTAKALGLTVSNHVRLTRELHEALK